MIYNLRIYKAELNKWIYPEITHPNKIHLIKTPKWLQYLFMERDGYDVMDINDNNQNNQQNNQNQQPQMF